MLIQLYQSGFIIMAACHMLHLGVQSWLKLLGIPFIKKDPLTSQHLCGQSHLA